MYCGIYHKICIPFVLLLASPEGHTKRVASAQPSLPFATATPQPPSFFAQVLGCRHRVPQVDFSEIKPVNQMGQTVHQEPANININLSFPALNLPPAGGYNFSRYKSELLVLIPIKYWSKDSQPGKYGSI